MLWIAHKLKPVKSNRGAALLTVLVAVMLITMMTFELQYASTIERKLAYNDLDHVRAYYLAKSGARMGLLRISLYARIKKNKDLKTLAQSFDISPFLNLIWTLPLPAFPPETSSLAKLNKADKDAAETTLEQTRVSQGQTTHVISSEASKINLNYLVVPASQRDKPIRFTGQPQSLVEHVGQLLVNLIDGFIRESENPADEYGSLRPETVVYEIMDWVNPGETAFAGGSKDAFYEQQNPPYKAKRGRMFTIEELKMIRSVDDHLYNKLKPHVTVNSFDGKININTASTTIYKALYPDFTEDDLKRLMEERNKIGAWPTDKAFVDYVANTLGRQGFKNIYNDEKNYPFTVSNQSFVIESMGMIKKSGSTIQKTIRVAVALTNTSGAVVDSTIKDQRKCEENPMMFFDFRDQNCKTRPRTQEQCVNQLAGGWVTENGKQGCKLNNQPVVFPPENTAVQDPNAVKILSWIES